MSFRVIVKLLPFTHQLFTITITPVIPNIIIIVNPDFRFYLKLRFNPALGPIRPLWLNPPINLAVFFGPSRRVTLPHRPPIVGQLGWFRLLLFLHHHRVVKRGPLYPCGLRISLPRQLVRSTVRDGPVDGQGDCGVEASEHESVRGNLLTAVHVDLPMLVVFQNTDALESRCSRGSQVIDEKFQVKFCRVCGSKPDSTGEVRLDAGP